MLLTETFGLFNDEDLTESHSGFEDYNHFTDESDNPRDKQVWFGSLGTLAADVDNRKVQALTDPGVDDITFTPVYILPEWDNNTAYSLGDNVGAVGYRYRCTTAGTSHATTEPIWPTAGIGSTVIDGTVVWTLVSAIHAVTEITLGLTQEDLDTNTPGAALAIGNTILSSTAEAVSFWIRVENNVNTVSNNVSTPELALQFTPLYETENV